MQYLIISDIHENLEGLNKILTKFSHIPNKVALGDWYDTHFATGASVRDVARAQREFVSDPNNASFYGNHCIQYAYPQIDGLYCSGRNDSKIPVIREEMGDHRDKLKLHLWLNLNGKVWLLSHAGFHPTFLLTDRGVATDGCEGFVREESEKALYDLNSYRMHPLVGAGWARGGNQKHGGCTWLDFNDEFVATPGINQIVGHTHNRKGLVKEIHDDNSENYCIDTGLKHVAILDDSGEVEIVEV